MTRNTDWLFNELKMAGIDYNADAVAGEYDTRHNFRDFQKEADGIAEALQLTNESVVIDLGCGTGGLSIPLARKCRHVYAADISRAMIDTLQKNSAEQNIGNITGIQAGFLGYQHSGDPADAIISTVALHHLPDFWKQIALIRIRSMLKDGGKFFLGDVVFDFEPQNYGQEINGWLSAMENVAGEKIKQESVVHIRDEYSTWDWVLRGMLEKAGFNILFSGETGKNMRFYICGT